MPRRPNPQNRLACDRCHAQKLRCQREEGQGFCVRCARSSATCVFSPRQRRNVHVAGCDIDFSPSSTVQAIRATAALPAAAPAPRPSHKEAPGGGPEPAQDGNHDAFNLDLLIDDALSSGQQASTDKRRGFSPFRFALSTDDNLASSIPLAWSTFLDPGIAGSLPSHDPSTASLGFWPDSHRALAEPQDIIPSRIPAPTMSTPAAHPSPHATSSVGAVQPTDPIHHVCQLADLHVQLYEHAQTLPPLSMATRDRTPTLDGRVFAIDKTFTMTQTLIDLINQLYPPQTAHTEPGSESAAVGTAAPDQATVLLLLSCAGRVFDIYEVIFGHMRGCIEHQLTPVTAGGKTLLLPQLRIGTFAPPTPAAIVMHMLMVVLMASNLFEQLQEVLGVQSSEGDGVVGPVWGRHGQSEVELAVGSRSCFPELSDQARSEVSYRASTLAEEMGTTRQLLLKLSMTGKQTIGSLPKGTQRDEQGCSPGRA